MPSKGQCRFCLESDIIQNLISPCNCKGSVKYVHNDCLVKWTEARPTTGHICNSCGIECQRVMQDDFKIISLVFKENILCLKCPYTILSTNQWASFFIYMSLYPLFSYYSIYLIYQTIFHCIYMSYFFYILSKVHNFRVYMIHWILNILLVVPLSHIFFVYTFPFAFYIGGIGMNICVFIYFYEHYRILHKFETQKKITFLSKE